MATLSRVMSAANLGGSCPIVLEYEASQALLPGDFVFLNASGQLATVATDNGAMNTTTSTKWVGRALGSANAGESVVVIVANENTLFEVPVFHATPASAVLQRSQLQADYAGICKFVISGDANSRTHAVDVGNTTNPIFRPLAFIKHSAHKVPGVNIPWGDNGEQYGRVGVVILSTARRLS